MVYSGILKLPWEAEDFLFYCCPDCDTRTKQKDDFVQHAHTHVSGKSLRTEKEYSEKIKLENESFDINIVKDEDQEMNDQSNDYDWDTNEVYSDHNDEAMSDCSDPDWFDESKNSGQEETFEDDLKQECWECCEEFSIKDLTDHMFKVHGHRKIHKCPSCDASFRYQKTLNSHESKEHGKGSRVRRKKTIEDDFMDEPIVDNLQCWQCEDAQTYTVEHLTNHMNEIHGHKKIMKCSTCPAAFRNHKTLLSHEERKHGQGDLKSENNFFDMNNTQSEGTPEKQKVYKVGGNQLCWQCPNSNKYSQRDLVRHMKYTHGHIRIFKCALCPMAFGTKKAIEIHEAKIHGTRSLESVIPDTIEGSETKKSDDKVYKRGGIFSCWQCPESENYSHRDLLKHMTEVHGHVKIFKCSYCDVAFRNKKAIEYHEAKIHGQGTIETIICSRCTFTTHSKALLKNHTDRIHGEKAKTNLCSQCPMAFLDIGDLYKHVRNVHTFEKHNCTDCSESFKSIKELRGHMIEKHNRQSFNCEKCEARFTSSRGLDAHVLKIHEKTLPFQCTICPMAYAYKKDLVRHTVKKHTDDKPFSCDICQKRFQLRDELKSHLKNKHKQIPCKEQLMPNPVERPNIDKQNHFVHNNVSDYIMKRNTSDHLFKSGAQGT